MMKINEEIKWKHAEEAFSALAIVVLLILSLWGALAMLVGSLIGLAAFTFIFQSRLRARGWRKAAVSVAAAASAAAAAAVIAFFAI